MSAPSVARTLRLSEALDAFHVSKVRADGSKVSNAEANGAGQIVLEAVRRIARSLDPSEAQSEPERIRDLVSIVVSKVFTTPLIATLLKGAMMPALPAELDRLDAMCGAYLKKMLQNARVDMARKDALDPLAMGPEPTGDPDAEVVTAENVSAAVSAKLAQEDDEKEMNLRMQAHPDAAHKLVDKLLEETLRIKQSQHHVGYRESYADIWELLRGNTTIEKVIENREKVARSLQNEDKWISARNAVQQRHCNLRKAMVATLDGLIACTIVPTQSWAPGEMELLKIHLLDLLLRRSSK